MNNVRQNAFGFYGHAVLLSLPAVLLVYALIAFAVSLAVYTVQGLQLLNRAADGVEHSGEEAVWSWWIVVGIVAVMVFAVGMALYTFSVIWNFKIKRKWLASFQRFRRAS
jgi:hypothetical protein